MEKLNKQLVNVTKAPEKVIQFGEGNFMRGFVDWQFQQMNKKGLFNGSAAVVQPIDHGLGEMLAEQDYLYTVVLEGILDGAVVNSAEIIETVSRVINPYQNWEDYLALAENDALEFIVSNTTEAGISYDEKDKLTDTPPNSFPAKLTALLYRRFKLGKTGFTIIPCELIDRNGEKLKEIVMQYTAKWRLGCEFINWLNNENTFCCSLVDRIVPGYPRDKATELNEKHGYIDNLMVKAEPFMLWVIEGPESLKEALPLEQAGLNVIVTDDMTPYRERKVHLLNGPHTAMVPLAQLAGIETVEEVMNDADFSVFVDRLFAAELIPMLSLPQTELEVYANQIKERFKNPFVRHELASISLNSVSKYRARLLPIVEKYLAKEQEMPEYLSAALAALILTYRDDRFTSIDDDYALTVLQADYASDTDMIQTILQDTKLWGQDLTMLSGFTAAIATKLAEINEKGSRSVIQALNKGEYTWLQQPILS